MQHSDSKNLVLGQSLKNKRLFREILATSMGIYRREWKYFHPFIEGALRWSLRRPQLLKGIPQTTGKRITIGGNTLYNRWVLTTTASYTRTTVPGKGFLFMVACSRKI